MHIVACDHAFPHTFFFLALIFQPRTGWKHRIQAAAPRPDGQPITVAGDPNVLPPRRGDGPLHVPDWRGGRRVSLPPRLRQRRGIGQDIGMHRPEPQRRRSGAADDPRRGRAGNERQQRQAAPLDR